MKSSRYPDLREFGTPSIPLSMTNDSSIKWLRAAAALTIVLHVAGLIAALVWIRPASSVYPVDARMLHIAAPGSGWKIGWVVWMFGAMAFVAFNAAVEKTWDLKSVSARLGVMIGVAAAALDCLFDMMQIVVLPEFVTGGRGQNVFVAFARLSSGGGIIVANGLYAISVALLSVALRGRISRIAFWLGMATLIFGLALSAAGFCSEPSREFVAARPGAIHLPEWFVGPTFAAYLLWVFVLALQGPRIPAEN